MTLRPDENIDEAYEAVAEEDDVYDGVCLQDCESEFRESGDRTDIPCDWSRHYESESRARQLSDGSWISGHTGTEAESTENRNRSIG